jgi:hypothetical protein
LRKRPSTYSFVSIHWRTYSSILSRSNVQTGAFIMHLPTPWNATVDNGRFEISARSDISERSVFW